MSDVVNLNEHRAIAANDARLWTVTDALRSVLRDIEEGRIAPTMIYIAMCEPRDDGPDIYGFACAGTTNLGIIGLLAKHLNSASKS